MRLENFQTAHETPHCLHAWGWHGDGMGMAWGWHGDGMGMAWGWHGGEWPSLNMRHTAAARHGGAPPLRQGGPESWLPYLDNLAERGHGPGREQPRRPW